MTAFSPYQAYPGPAPVPAAPPPVLVAVADPAPQRRVTVAFRLILAVPQLFVLYWVLLAADVVAFVGWWGALFTGRLPQFAVTFVSGALRWATRVLAYTSLLTDVYPPFTMDDDPAYPVRVAIPEAQRLNRAAVFFRYFLCIPASILHTVLLYGAWTLMAFVAWLIALVGGQLPPSLYLAYVAALRFMTRYYGFFWMLTPAYPGGLYGDKPGTVAWADQLPTAPGFGMQAPGFGMPGQAYATPGMTYGTPTDAAPQGYGPPQGYGSPQAYGSSQGYDLTQGYGAPPGYGAPQGYGLPQAYGNPQGYEPVQGYGGPQGYAGPQGYGVPTAGYGAAVGYSAPGGYGVRPVFQPATWLLPLTSGAKKLVTTFIVLGSLFFGGYVISEAVTISSTFGSINNSQTALTAINQLNSSYNTLFGGLPAWEQAATNCDQNLTCVDKEFAKMASAFNTFTSQVANTPVPAGAAADKSRLIATATASTQKLAALSRVTTVSQFQSTIASSHIQQTLADLDQNMMALIKKLQTY